MPASPDSESLSGLPRFTSQSIVLLSILEAATFTVFRAGNNPAEKPLISHPNPNYGLTPFLAKARLQNYLGAAACNLKRWLRRLAWEMQPPRLAAVN